MQRRIPDNTLLKPRELCCNMLLTVVLYLLLTTTSVLCSPAKKPYFPVNDVCKPICPCLYEGVFYSNGDEWSPVDKPCIKYRCKNGIYEPVSLGCKFHDECKLANTTWTEKCMTFKCIPFLEDGTAQYRLIEGGCEASDGTCLNVGERISERCNDFECQIVDGTCYELVQVGEGCLYGGECKKLNSFWHDGCSVFQCEKRESYAFYYLQFNERMYWPEGNYSLLETIGGCPRDVPEEWYKGSRLHWSNGQSFVSDPFHLLGNYTSEYFNHRFCTHKGVTDLSRRPRYQTYWDAGRYCIMRYGGKCPQGFKEGYIEMDDLNTMEPFGRLDGIPPDGNYTFNTGIFFCCREDGHTQHAITLPRDFPFALFMLSGENVCQEVKGMAVKKEFFTFDDEDVNVHLRTVGLTPEIKDCDNNTMIYFCFYTPLDCGCEDASGNIIPEGKTETRGCVTYECRNLQNIRYLEVVNGGCEFRDHCMQVNTTWNIFDGESCETMRCVSDVDEKGKTIFKSISVHKGCKDENVCRPTGYLRNQGCYVLSCEINKMMKRHQFVYKKAGCSDGSGGCIPLGEVIKKDCISYKCSQKESSCGNEFVEGQCFYKNKCYSVGTVFKDSEDSEDYGCTEFVCNQTRRGNSLMFGVTIRRARCSFKGQCYGIGENVRDGCYIRECTANAQGHACRMAIKSGGCQTDEGCKDVGAVWNKNCVTYKCKMKYEQNIYTFTQDVETIRCSHNGRCVEPGETVVANCHTYMCKTSYENKHYTASLKLVSGSVCRDPQGNCIAEGEEIEEECSTLKCTKNNGHPMLVRTGLGCMHNGICQNNGSVWHDSEKCIDLECITSASSDGKWKVGIHTKGVGCRIGGTCYRQDSNWKDGCIQKTCRTMRQGSGSYSYRIEHRGCMDSQGKCRVSGEEWHEARGSFCLVSRCSHTENGDQTENDNLLCRDADGKCHEVGSSGFSINYSGRIYKNCTCKPNGKHGTPSCRG